MNYIYNQQDEKARRYGLRSSAATGCGWVAIHNALCAMGYRIPTDALIRQLEHQAPGLHGNFGTLALSPMLWFRRQGFPAKATLHRHEFDEALRSCDCGILFYYWKKKYRIGSHFIMVRSTKDGILGYNVYSNSEKEANLGLSLEEWIQKSGHFGCILTTIKKK